MTQEWEDAVRRGTVDSLRRLWAGGADIDARDRRNQTALMRAATRGQKDVVAWLVKHGALLNHTAKYGLSAIMLAVVNKHAAVVQILADAGANLDLRGTGAPGFAGKTALELAIAQHDQDMVDVLQSGAEPRG